MTAKVAEASSPGARLTQHVPMLSWLPGCDRSWVWAWVAQMLWRVDPSAWVFLAVITIFNLTMNFVILVSGGDWYDVNVSVIVNALILIYVMLPGTRRAFGQQQ
jgi:hypothetical protein